MNIAIFSPSKNPYSETFIQAHKELLRGNVFYYYGKLNKIKLEGSSEIVSKLKRKELQLSRKIRGKSESFIHQKSLIKSLEKNKIHVILIEYGTHAYNLLSVLKQITIPFIVHFHGYDASVKDIIKYCNGYEEVFELASKIIVVSKVMEDKMLDLGCPSEKIVYNVYGPRPEFENVIPNFKKEQFIAIGRFTNKKAPYYTILSFEKVLREYPNSRLVMAGDGELLNTCKNLVNHYGLANSVNFVGVITPKFFRDYLSESVAFVQHSVTASNGDMEGTPLSVLEASAAGLPVISTIHAGIPDVIVHNKTGLLCEEHDVEGMSVNMMKVLEDKTYAKRLGESGKKRVIDHFSLKTHINKLQEVFNDITTNKAI